MRSFGARKNLSRICRYGEKFFTRKTSRLLFFILYGVRSHNVMSISWSDSALGPRKYSDKHCNHRVEKRIEIHPELKIHPELACPPKPWRRRVEGCICFIGWCRGPGGRPGGRSAFVRSEMYKPLAFTFLSLTHALNWRHKDFQSSAPRRPAALRQDGRARLLSRQNFKLFDGSAAGTTNYSLKIKPVSLVPRARIELATQGFSVLCSTTELPRRCVLF